MCHRNAVPCAICLRLQVQARRSRHGASWRQTHAARRRGDQLSVRRPCSQPSYLAKWLPLGDSHAESPQASRARGPLRALDHIPYASRSPSRACRPSKRQPSPPLTTFPYTPESPPTSRGPHDPATKCRSHGHSTCGRCRAWRRWSGRSRSRWCAAPRPCLYR